MHKLIDLIEYFSDFFDDEDNPYIATNCDIYVNYISIRNVKVRLLRNGQFIGTNDFASDEATPTRVIIENMTTIVTNRCKIFVLKKPELQIEYNVEYDNEAQGLIDEFAKHVSGKEAVMREFRENDIIDFIFGIADGKLFIISKYDTTILCVAEFAMPNKIIMRSFDRDYDNMANVYLRSYVEFIDGKLTYDFEFINRDTPKLTVRTFLSGRIMDTEYMKYNHKFFEELFTRQ